MRAMTIMRTNYNYLDSNKERRISRYEPGDYDTDKISLKKSKLCLKYGKEVTQHQSI